MTSFVYNSPPSFLYTIFFLKICNLLVVFTRLFFVSWCLGSSLFLKITSPHFESEAWGEIGYSDANTHKAMSCFCLCFCAFVCFLLFSGRVAFFRNSIVIIRNWLGNPANCKGTNTDRKIYVGRSTTLHNLLFCTRTLWPNYVTVTFLLVSSSVTNHDLLCLCRVMAKKANKNIEQRICQAS